MPKKQFGHQLTKKGMEQQFKFGKILREMYGGFVGKAYKPENVFVRSSEFDRTKESLQLFLTGLFSQNSERVQLNKFNSSAIPYHVLPVPFDFIFEQYSCVLYQTEYKENMKSNEKIKEKLKGFEYLMKFFSTQYPDINISLGMMFGINSFLLIEQRLNRPLPDWYTPERQSDLIKAAKFFLESVFYTPSLLRNSIGGMMSSILNNMNFNGTKVQPRKLYIYSGHDINVYGIAKAHGVTLPIVPDFASAIIIEVWRHRKTGEAFVKVLFYEGKGTLKPPQPLKIPSYGESLTVDEYLELTTPMIATKKQYDCFWERNTGELEQILTDHLTSFHSYNV